MSKTTVYEIAILYHMDCEAALDKATAKVKKLITDNGGKIVKEESWGKRQLAYSVKRQTHAIYVFYDVEISGLSLAKIETAFNITEEVLRYMFHVSDLKAKEAILARQAAEAKEKKTKEKELETVAEEKAEVKQNVA